MKRLIISVLFYLAGLGMALAAVNLNTATVAELDAVKGIGQAKAQAIVDYRTKNGPFKSVEDLRSVKGFGEKSVAKLKSELSVGDTPVKPAPAKPAAK